MLRLGKVVHVSRISTTLTNWDNQCSYMHPPSTRSVCFRFSILHPLCSELFVLFCSV
jgi:hypothetical protein